MKTQFKFPTTKMLKLLTMLVVSLLLTNCDDKAVDQEVCQECQSSELTDIRLNKEPEIRIKSIRYFNNFISEFEQKFDIEHGTISNLQENEEARTIWIPAKNQTPTEKLGVYAYIYENEIQVGYKASWNQDANGLRSITHSNLKDQNIYKVYENSDRETKIQKINTTSSVLLFAYNNLALSNGSTTGVEKKCTFIDNLGSCISQQITQVYSHAILGVTCLAFGPECATFVGVSCTTRATISTTKGKCI
jgi:hypothetical protein